MFTILCPQEAAEILLGPRRIERLEHTDEGIVIHWRCYCGTTGTSLTGVARCPVESRSAA